MNYLISICGRRSYTSRRSRHAPRFADTTPNVQTGSDGNCLEREREGRVRTWEFVEVEFGLSDDLRDPPSVNASQNPDSMVQDDELGLHLRRFLPSLEHSFR